MKNHGTTKYGKPSQDVCLQYQLVVDLYIHHSGPLGDINKLYFFEDYINANCKTKVGS